MDNGRLCSTPTSQEVHNALIFIPVDSSPDPDDFGSDFYRSYWHIVGSDVVEGMAKFIRRWLSLDFILLLSWS